MNNCTISTKFFADVLKLDTQSQLYVLSTCQQLVDSDNDTIGQFELPADAPGVLVDFVKRLKRRVRNACRRAARPKAGTNHGSSSVAKPAMTTTPQSDNSQVDKPRNVNHAVKMLEVASAYVLELGDTFDLKQLKHIYKLVSKVLVTFRDDLYLLRKKADSRACLHSVADYCPA